MTESAGQGSGHVAPDLAAELREVNERLLISGLREHESAEVAERERAQLSALLEALHEGVVMVATGGRVLLANAALRTLLALAPTAQLSLEALTAVELRDGGGALVPVADQPLHRALRGEDFVDVEHVLVRAGRERRLLTSGTSIKAGGEVTLAIVVTRDVTERRQLEARLSQTERLAAIGTLSAGMAHEINNPLTYVLGNVDLALEALPEVQKQVRALGGDSADVLVQRLNAISEALSEAREGSVRVHRIVHELKTFARLDAATQSVLSLSEVIDGVLRMTNNHLRHHATVRRDYRATPPVRANAGQLGQVFTNLVMNAVQALDDGASETNEVAVTTYTDGSGRAVAEVRDTGGGIPEDIKRRIFDPFFTTKPVGHGTGLGLAIGYSIIESLGGRLSVETKLGEGSTFRVVLPAAEGVPSSRPPPVATLVPCRPGRILVIDDEPAIGRLLARMLAREHDVVVLTDARVALTRIASGETFDVIFCDLMMPGMAGIDFHEALLRQDAKLAERVVFLTGGAFTPRAEAFLKSTRNPTLLKPIKLEALRTIVAERVSQPG